MSQVVMDPHIEFVMAPHTVMRSHGVQDHQQSYHKNLVVFALLVLGFLDRSWSLLAHEAHVFAPRVVLQLVLDVYLILYVEDVESLVEQ